MRDLLESLQKIAEAPLTDKSGKPVMSKSGPVKQGSGPAPRNTSYKNVGDMVKAITTPGRQGFDDPNKSAAAVKAATAPAPKPKLGGTGVGRQDGPAALRPAPVKRTGPVGGPTRANATKPMMQPKAAPAPASQVTPTAGDPGMQQAAAPKMATPTAPPARPKQRAKVKATAANTKDFDKTVALQKKLGVTADGIMGPETRRAMALAKAKEKEPGRDAASVTGRDADGQYDQDTPDRTPTPTDAGEFATAASPAAKAFTPIKGAGDRKSGATAADIRRDAGNKAVARDFGRAKEAGKNMLSRIAGAFTRRGDARTTAGPNAPGSNFRTAADGSISRTDNVRQPDRSAPGLARRGDDQQPAPTTRSARRGDDQEPAPTTRTAAANTVTFTDKKAIRLAKAADAALKAGNTRAASKLQANARNRQRAVTQADPNYVPPTASQAAIDRAEKLGGVI